MERTLKILWALSLWQTGTLGLSAAAFTTAFLESFITIFTKEFSPFQSGCWHGNCSPPPTCDCGAMDGADASSYPYGLAAGAAANVPTFHRASAWMSQTTNGKNKDWPSWVSEQGSPPSMYEKYHESPPPLDVTDYIKKHPKNCTIDATTVFACGTAREYYDPASPMQCCITTAQQAGEGKLLFPGQRVIAGVRQNDKIHRNPGPGDGAVNRGDAGEGGERVFVADGHRDHRARLRCLKRGAGRRRSAAEKPDQR